MKKQMISADKNFLMLSGILFLLLGLSGSAVAGEQPRLPLDSLTGKTFVVDAMVTPYTASASQIDGGAVRLEKAVYSAFFTGHLIEFNSIRVEDGVLFLEGTATSVILEKMDKSCNDDGNCIDMPQISHVQVPFVQKISLIEN